MSPAASIKLGPYEIVAPIGAGEMGEVYRARDSKLAREVSLKVLPAGFASDSERMARFEREAKVLASLNHPNIAHIYGLEGCSEVRALIMELVEGSTLAERIGRGPIPLVSRAIGLVALGVLILFGILTGANGWAQSQTSGTSTRGVRLEYEVVSIKPNNPANGNRRVGGGMHFTPDAFSVEGVTLQRLIQEAYGGIDENQILGAPNWFTSEKYDIDAKTDDSVADELQKLTPDQRLIEQYRMLQTLLESRFKLKVHRETKEVPIYMLVTAKSGPKLHEAKPGDTYPSGIKIPAGLSTSGVMMMQAGELTAQAVPVEKLVGYLKMSLHRPVVDKTGLVGNYDFKLQFTPDRTTIQPSSDSASGSPLALVPGDPAGPSIFTAIQEQLGLKLISGSGPIDIIVVDHVERPSRN